MRYIFLAIYLISASLAASAGFTLPKHAYTINRLSEATAEAVKSQRPLVFLRSDTRSTCPLCENATETAFKEFKRFAVIVYLQSTDKDTDPKLSPLVREAFQLPGAGKYIPQAVLLSPDQKTFWGHITYESMKDSDGFRAARKNVEAYQTKKSTPPTQPANLFWGLKESGRGYRGAFVGVKDDKLLLKIEKGGKEAGFELNRFEPGVLEYVKNLTSTPTPVSTTPVRASLTATGQLETWNSTEGRTLSATFISLQNDILILRGADGQTFHISISRLSPASQARARALMNP